MIKYHQLVVISGRFVVRATHCTQVRVAVLSVMVLHWQFIPSMATASNTVTVVVLFISTDSTSPCAARLICSSVNRHIASKFFITMRRSDSELALDTFECELKVNITFKNVR
jgi:hypothetical protein